MRVSDIAYGFKRYALHERGMRPRSYKSITSSLEMLCAWADTEELAQLTHATIKEFLYWGREEKAWEARTFRNHRQYLKSYFDWCVNQRYLSTNPILGIAKPKLPARLPRCLNRNHTRKILDYPRWHKWRYEFETIRNEAILYCLVFTGLRLQEMLNLELSDINLKSREILVRQGKGQKDRVVPIHPRLVRVLQNYLAARKLRGKQGRHVFVSVGSDKSMGGKAVRRVCRTVSAGTKVYFTPHMLRHTFGRLMVEAGVDIFKIKEMMGHSSISTTQIYLSVSTENLKHTLEEIDLV